MGKVKKWIEEYRQSKVQNAMSDENLLTLAGEIHDRKNNGTPGYKALKNTWQDLYKRAVDYYNNESHQSFYDTYSGTRNKTGYVADTGQWYSNLETLKTQNNADAEKLLAELEQYSRYYNPEAISYVRDLITKRQSSYDEMMTDAKKFSDYWGQWATQGEYDTAVLDNDFYSAVESGDIDAVNAQFKKMYEQFLKEYGEEGALDAMSKASPAYGGELDAAGKRAKQLTEYAEYVKQLEEHTEYKPFWDAIESGDLAGAEAFLTEKGNGVGVQEYWNTLNYYKDDATYKENNASYLGLMQNDDFADKSQYRSTKTGDREIDWFATIGTNLANAVLDAQQGSKTVYKEGQGYADIVYDIINGNPEAKQYADLKNLSDYGALAVASGLASTDYMTMLTEDEKKIFNYIYATEGKDKAYEYFSHLEKNYLNQRNREAIEKQWTEWSEKAPILTSLGTIALAPAKGISFLAQTADYLADGELEDDARYNALLYGSNSTKSTVSKMAEDKWGEFGSFAYGVGMSMGEFLMTTAASGGNAILTGIVMGSGAAAETTLSGVDRGLDSTRAYTSGIIAGLTEFFTEKMGVDNLFDLKLLGKSKFRYVLKNALGEGGEEGLTDLITWAADDIYDLISGQDMSEWKQAIAEYEKLGYSASEAAGMALGDRAGQLGTDILAGAVSGGIMGGAGALSQTIQEYREGSKYKSDPSALIEEALRLDPKDAYALKLKAKLDAGEKISQAQLGKLSFGNMETVQGNLAQNDKNSRSQIAATFEKKLSSGIENKQARAAMAETLTKIVYGEHVSNSELRKISQSKKALKGMSGNRKLRKQMMKQMGISDLDLDSLE